MAFDPLNPKNLTDDVTYEILSYLSPTELGICSGVDKNWQKLAGNPMLWLTFFKNAQLNFQNLPPNPKRIFDRISIKSFDELALKLKEFMAQVTLDRQAEFICFFINKGCSIQVRSGKKQGNCKKNHLTPNILRRYSGLHPASFLLFGTPNFSDVSALSRFNAIFFTSEKFSAA